MKDLFKIVPTKDVLGKDANALVVQFVDGSYGPDAIQFASKELIEKYGGELKRVMNNAMTIDNALVANRSIVKGIIIGGTIALTGVVVGKYIPRGVKYVRTKINKSKEIKE